jgi:hypothetical protein
MTLPREALNLVDRIIHTFNTFIKDLIVSNLPSDPNERKPDNRVSPPDFLIAPAAHQHPV